MLSIEIHTAIPSEVTIEIFDILGRRLAPVLHTTTGSASQTVSWDALSATELSRLPAGMYILHASINDASHYQTYIVKQ